MQLPQIPGLKKFSSAWAFPCCGCGCFGLIIIISIMAFSATFSRHVGEQSLLSGGVGNCETTETKDFSGKTYKIPATSGGISQEDHLATSAETFSGRDYPSSEKEGLDNHLSITNYSTNCSGCPKGKWTPPEGGLMGQGSGSKPPASTEPWGMNMRWKDATGNKINPPAGTKVIITATKTGKSVVAAAGYEWGPGNTQYIAGAQNEVLHNLDISHGGEVTIGFAVDQTVPYGPINCACAGEVLATPGPSGYVCPLLPPGARVERGYNLAHRIGNQADLNKGSGEDDFGEKILAIRSGKVIYAWDQFANRCDTGDCRNGRKYPHGNAVKILQNDGHITNYGHIKQYSARQYGIEVGVYVQTGQVIAEVDDVGNSSASHLHIQISRMIRVNAFMRQLCK